MVHIFTICTILEITTTNRTIMETFGKCVAFLQGDDANKIFDLMYPKGNTNGDHRTTRVAHNAMIEHITSEDTEYRIELLPYSSSSGHFVTRHYIMLWNYPYNWIALYQKVYKKDMVEVK